MVNEVLARVQELAGSFDASADLALPVAFAAEAVVVVAVKLVRVATSDHTHLNPDIVTVERISREIGDAGLVIGVAVRGHS